MIALAITREPVEGIDRLGTTRRIRVGAWWVTAMAAGVLAAIEESPRREVLVLERVPSPTGPRTILLRGTIAPETAEIRVVRCGIGGRAFLHARTTDGGFAGATHVSALRALGVPIAEDPAGLPELFAYGGVTPPDTVFRGIQDVPIAGSLRVRLADHGLIVEQSSGCDALVEAGSRAGGLTGEEVVEATIAHLSATVGELAGNGAPVVSLLSGGLDSSVLARIASSHPGGRRSMSTGYPFEDTARNSEREYALSAARALSLDHRYYEPSLEEYLHGVLTSTLSYEQPVYGLQTVLLGLLFAREVPPAAGAPVLCGEGADSIFGGTTHIRLSADCGGDRLSRALAGLPGLESLLEIAGKWWWRAERLREQIEPIQDRQRPLGDPRHPLWAHERDGSVPWILRHFGVPADTIMRGAFAAMRPFAHRRLEDLVTIRSLQGSVHTVQSMWSKAAEAGGWAMVYPYTDENLVRTVMRTGWKDKLLSTKHLLRLAARRLGVPEFVVMRPKLSFSVDTRRWALPGGPLEPLVRLAANVVPLDTLRELQQPEYHTAQLFWRALAYAIWTRLVIREEPIAGLHAELDEAIGQTSGHRA